MGAGRGRRPQDRQARAAQGSGAAPSRCAWPPRRPSAARRSTGHHVVARPRRGRDVRPQLLWSDDRGNLLAHACLVVRVGRMRRRHVGGAGLTDLGGLRERSDGGRGQQGQVGARSGRPRAQNGAQGGRRRSQRSTGGPGARRRARRHALRTRVASGDLRRRGVPAFVEAAGGVSDLENLLVSEGRQACRLSLRVASSQVSSAVSWGTLQGVGGGDGDACGAGPVRP